ncbi:CRAL-TRIO domain-containing protein [Aspergillus cavernicola]|uniref:CRAL-TRIO domain-containing protein n=1 Tax=Aspergillus cavernicola TaxID=176166 RepID=A0ABR4I751_9EURO
MTVGLKTEEASALATFSDLCAEQGLLKRRDGLKDEDFNDGFTDESTLLRFLQANRMDPSRALQQFQQATTFHSENDAVRLYNLISVEDYEDTRLLYPHWTGRCDNHGRPILMIDMHALSREALTHWRAIRDIPAGTLSGDDSMSTPNMPQRTLVHFDGFTRFALPLCSAVYTSKPVTNCSYIVDASSISLRQAWDVREFARDSSWILATCFPETIYRVYVCNVPAYFSRLWKILKPLIDPVTADKIVFLHSTEAYAVLNEEIDRVNIPTNFGGDFEFKTGMLPDFDNEIRQALQWSIPKESLPSGPIKWVRGESGEMRAVATGTVGGVLRAEEIAILAEPGSRNGTVDHPGLP